MLLNCNITASRVQTFRHLDYLDWTFGAHTHKAYRITVISNRSAIVSISTEQHAQISKD